MYKGILHTHYLVVTLFFILYVIKTVLLLSNRNEVLAAFNRKTKVIEMIVSVLFLITGIYLATKLPFGGKYDYLFYIKLVMIAAAIPLAIIGFRRANKILAALSLLLITASYATAEAYAKRKGIRSAETAATGETVNSAQALYDRNCSLCHGGDGKLGATGAKDLSTTALNAEGISEVILNGKGTMARVRVTKEEADMIASYVEQELKGR
jgi:mono/diheme cytochrome c family protein